MHRHCNVAKKNAGCRFFTSTSGMNALIRAQGLVLLFFKAKEVPPDTLLTRSYLGWWPYPLSLLCYLCLWRL